MVNINLETLFWVVVGITAAISASYIIMVGLNKKRKVRKILGAIALIAIAITLSVIILITVVAKSGDPIGEKISSSYLGSIPKEKLDFKDDYGILIVKFPNGEKIFPTSLVKNYHKVDYVSTNVTLKEVLVDKGMNILGIDFTMPHAEKILVAVILD